MGQAASAASDEDPVEHILASMPPGYENDGPHVYISHAAEQKMTVVDVVWARLADKHPQLDVVVDEWSLQPGDRPMARIGAAVWGAAVGVVVLSKEFVRKEHCMAELRILLQRMSGGGLAGPQPVNQLCSRQLPVQPLPVLFGLTVLQVKDMRALYDSEPWCVNGPKPSPAVLDEWAAELRHLTQLTCITAEQWRGYSELAKLIELRVVHLLHAAGKLPQAPLPTMGLNRIRSLPTTPLVRRQAEVLQIAHALAQDHTQQVASAASAEDPVEGVLANMAPGHEEEPDKVPHVYISHAGEQKRTVVDVVRARFADKHPQLDVFGGEWSLMGGDSAMARIGAAVRGAAVGVVVLSKEFVRKAHCMAELRILLQRMSGGGLAGPQPANQLRSRQLPVRLLPVLVGLTVVQVKGMRALYDSEPWCVNGPKPSAAVLDAWAADLQQLLRVTCIMEDQWRGLSQLAEVIEMGAVELLRSVGKMPHALPTMEVFSGITPPPATPLVGRQEELQRALQALAQSHYVEIRGLPGEGKSTLAQHVAQLVLHSEEWQRLPSTAADGSAAYALEVDLGGLDNSTDLKAAMAFKLLGMVGVPNQNAPWNSLLYWLRQPAVALCLILLENADKALAQEFQVMLSQLLALPHVYVIVATRVACPCPDQVTQRDTVVELRPLSARRAMRLMEARLGPGYIWGADDREAARQLATLFEGNPLSLSIASGLVRSNQGSWQGILDKAQGLHGGAGGMSRNMAALQHWLDSCLDDEQLQVLAAVSVFAGSFTSAGASAVSRVGGVEYLAGRLEVLEDLSLMRQRTVTGINSRQSERTAQRFSVHALVGAAAVSGVDMTVAQQHKQRFAEWMLVHNKGPGQALLRCAAGSTAADEHQRLHLLQEEELNFVAAGGDLQYAEHSATLLQAATRIGQVFSNCGISSVAKQLQRSALEGAECWLGPRHDVTLMAQHYLGLTLKDAGEYMEARCLIQDVLNIRLQELGANHSETLRAQRDLGATLWGMGMVADAAEVWDQLLTVELEVLDPCDISTLQTKRNVALAKRDMGEAEAARQLGAEVLDACAEELGSGHIETLRSMQQLAMTLKDLGNVEHAQELEEEALDGCSQLLGAEHPATLSAKRQLAATLLYMGQQGAARRLQQEVWEASKFVLGPEHPDTLAVRKDLAATLESMQEVVAPLHLRGTTAAASVAAAPAAAAVTDVGTASSTPVVHSAASLPQEATASSSAAASQGSRAPASLQCDVFISHAGEQKFGVVSHLEARLREHYPELKVFVDYRMRGGDGAWEEIKQHVQAAKAVVFVLSRAFVRKKYTMQELLLALECQHGSKVLMPVLAHCLPYETAVQLEDEYAADSECLGKYDCGTLQQWAAAVKSLMRCRTALLASKEFLGEASLVQKVVTDLVYQLRKAGYHIDRPLELPLPPVVLDFEQRRSAVADTLLQHPAVLLHGMPGAGKTTLAMDVVRLAAAHPRLKPLRVAVVRLAPDMTNRDVAAVQESLVRRLAPDAAARLLSPLTDPWEGRAWLRDALEGMELLLVVDNVWVSPSLGSCLCRLLPADLLHGVLAKGSVLLATSRDARVAEAWKGMHVFQVGLLQADDARQLFCLHAFEGKCVPGQLDVDGQDADSSIGAVIAKELPRVLGRCGGLAMALEVMACHLRTDEEKWSNWEDDMQTVFQDQATDGRTQEEKMLFAAYELSFNALRPQLQHTLLDIALLLAGELWADVYACYGQDLKYLASASLVQCVGAEVARWGPAASEAGGCGDGVKTAVVMVHDTLLEFCRSLVELQPGRAGLLGKWLAGGQQRAASVLGPHVWGAHCTEDTRALCPPSDAESPQARILRLREALLSPPELTRWPPAFPRLLLLELLWPQVAHTLPLLQPELPFSEAPKLRVLRLAGTQQDPTPVFLADFSKLQVLRLQHVEFPPPPTRYALPPSPADALAMLTTLKHLYLHSVRDLAALPLATLPGLESLQATTCSDLTHIDLGPSPRPTLSALHLANCSRLQHLALGPAHPRHLRALRHLHISTCPALPSLDIAPCQSLTSLDLAECVTLRTLHGVSALTSLRELHAQHCSELQALGGLGACTALQHLDLSDCCSLGSALEGLPSLGALSKLLLANCMSLPHLPPLHALPSLMHVDVFGCSSATSLEISHCPALTRLLGPGLTMTSLRRLTLEACPKLFPPPSISTLTTLTALRLQHLPGLPPLQLLPAASQVAAGSVGRAARSALVLTKLKGLRELTMEGVDLVSSSREGLARGNDAWAGVSLPSLEMLRASDKQGGRADWSRDSGWQQRTLQLLVD